MFPSNTNNASIRTNAYDIGQQANRIRENFDTSQQIILETSKAIEALNTEFGLQLIERMSHDVTADFTWLPSAQAELQRKTDELINKRDKMIEELGLRK